MPIEAGQETAAIITFLKRIGLTVQRENVEGETFLPGISIRRGAVIIDEPKLLYPGDLLHEAGHMALMTPAERSACDGDAGPNGGAEIAAIAWSYAAALEIGLDPAVVFHADGYKSGGSAILENFSVGRYIGVPMLQYYGLTTDPTHRNAPADAVMYPRMGRWLRS